MKKHKIHFIGIGGIGMSGIAEIFLLQGHEISGSDLNSSETTERLAAAGAKIGIGHDAKNIHAGLQVVVVSSAIRPTNPEYIEAKRLNIPVIPRAEILAEILRGKTGITVAGTHGKTTTTSMIAQVLMHAGLDPTVVVGGKVEAIGSNAKFGGGSAVVAEADESDGSFLLLPATYSVVTNIDTDHMEHYQTRDRLDEAFIQFTKNIPFYGLTWLCGDDAGIQKILPELTKPHQTYGLAAKNDLVATAVQVDGFTQRATILYHDQELGELTLNVLGRHNLLNALAAVGMGLTFGLSFQQIREALFDFRHVRRRFDQRYFNEKTGIRVVDDYGHHPTEVRAVLSTARDAKPKRIITIFQPHRYSRTQLCWNDFVTCFAETDVLLMLPIYSAGEDPIDGVTTSALCAEMRKKNPALATRIHEVSSMDSAQEWVLKNKADGDFILTLGAGSITKLAGQLAKVLE